MYVCMCVGGGTGKFQGGRCGSLPRKGGWVRGQRLIWEDTYGGFVKDEDVAGGEQGAG